MLTPIMQFGAVAGIASAVLLGGVGASAAFAIDHTNPPIDTSGSEIIGLSIDGGAFSSETVRPVLLSPTGAAGGDPNSAFVVSPGDTATGTLTVRNDSDLPGTMTATLENVLTDGPDSAAADDFFLDATVDGTPARDLLDGDVLDQATLLPGETRTITLDFVFPDEATTGNKAGGYQSGEYAQGERFLHYDLRVTLSGETPESPAPTPDQTTPAGQPGEPAQTEAQGPWGPLASTGGEMIPWLLPAAAAITAAGIAISRRKKAEDQSA